MFKKITYLALVIAIFLTANFTAIAGETKKTTSFSDVGKNYSWATEAINELIKKDVLSGIDGKHFAPESPVTKEQFAKMLVLALDIPMTENSANAESTETVKDTKEIVSEYKDVAPDRWSYPYINAAKAYLLNNAKDEFFPEENYTRENCAYAISCALNISGDKNLIDKNVLTYNFKDQNEINEDIKTAIAIIAERGIVKGADGYLRPDGEVTRAEAAVLLYRAINYKARKSDGLFITQTPIIGESTVSLEQAKKWAQKSGAHQRFVDIADYYWKYGEITGMRPEILYAQAAKETAYGKYTGQVKPEQNNWAGIKTKTATGDLPEDHETFLTPEDGVRGHFNHLSAYVGLEPVGEPHERYHNLKTMWWRGTVKYAEQLGGKWAPDVTYGYNIAAKVLPAMENTK